MHVMRLLRLAGTAAFVAGALACSSGSSTSPSGTLTATVTAPKPVLPSANAQVRFGDQPVTLTVQNAAVSQSAGTTYSFEIATDSTFASKVQVKDGVTESTSGQTSVKADTLPGGR